MRFLVSLKGLLRYSFAACVITFPAHLYRDHAGGGDTPSLVRRIEHICDAVVELESFEGQYIATKMVSRLPPNTSPQRSNDYHGVFKIHKLPCLNSLVPPASRLSVLVSGGSGGSVNDLAFCLRRKKFTIETYHLPIEGGVMERRVPENKDLKDRSQPGTTGCGSSKSSPLEF